MGHLKNCCLNVSRCKLLIGARCGVPTRVVELLTNVQKVSVRRNKTGRPVRYKRITDRGPLRRTEPCGSITYVSPTCHKPMLSASALPSDYVSNENILSLFDPTSCLPNRKTVNIDVSQVKYSESDLSRLIANDLTDKTYLQTAYQY